MRVLCYLDGTNIEQIRTAVSTMLRASNTTIAIVYVVDLEPRGTMERQRERFFRPPTLKPQHIERMQQAENATAQEVLVISPTQYPLNAKASRNVRSSPSLRNGPPTL